MNAKQLSKLEIIAAIFTIFGGVGFLYRAIADWQQLRQVPTLAVEYAEQQNHLSNIDGKLDVILSAMNLKYDPHRR